MKVKNHLKPYSKNELIGLRVQLTEPVSAGGGTFPRGSKGRIVKKKWHGDVIVTMDATFYPVEVMVPQEYVRPDTPRPDYVPPSQKQPKEESK